MNYVLNELCIKSKIKFLQNFTINFVEIFNFVEAF